VLQSKGLAEVISILDFGFWILDFGFWIFPTDESGGLKLRKKFICFHE
jgi:hypothetical protein